jgi:hypothetical protein
MIMDYSDPPKPERLWYHFRLQTLLVIVLNH